MSNLDDVIGMTGSVASGGATQAPAAGDASTQSQFISTLFNQLVQSTRLAHELPDADDHKYFVSTSPEYVTKSTAVQNQLLNLLGLISDAIIHKDEASLTRNKRSGVTVPTSTLYTSKTDTLDRFHTLSDTVDTALESVDLCLDAHRGVKRGNTAMETGSATIRSARGNNQFHSSATMLKPQRSFQHLIDNSSRTWIPILPTKPNAMKPLPDYDKLRREREEKGTSSSTSKSDDGMGDDEDDQTHAVIAKGSPSPKLSAAMTSHIASLGMSTEAKSPTASIYPHPYKYEIENMDWEAVRSRQLVATKEQLFQPLSKVQCLWVDDLKALEELVEDLENVTEIAIDLEHHSFRSYAGLTCLMQISTRKTDYLIDTLALRTELHRLNTSFTDPKIVKVLHGADSDIIWLQRDLGLYVVNLFDTGQAARVLEFQSFGLSYLLKHFCDVSTDKKYQLADWRIRPLSAEMLLYARMDTHYLLYIYDRLKNDLIARSKPEQNQFSPIQGVPYLLAQVLERSKQISLKTYEKEDQASMNSAMEFAFKMGVILQNDVQSRILVALFKLRDELARKEDESVFYMCSNPNLLQIIQNVPSDIQQLEAVCNKPVPPMVKNHGPLILQTINEARGTGATTFTSPFLASTLPQVTASPALGPMSTDGQDHGIGMAPPAMQTPQKASKGGLFGNNKSNLTAGGGLHPTPATQTSALFAQLSTSTPQHSNSGWVSQAIHDAAASSSSSISAASQSPVMTTDQLYSSANWIHASKTLERSLAAVKGSPIAHSSTSISIPLFDDSGNSPRRNSAIGFQALPSPVAKPSPFALLASSGPAESLENRLAMAQAYSALAQATNSSSALSSITHHTPAKPTKPSVPPSTHDAMDLDDDSSVLRTPNTGEPAHSFVSPSPMSLQVVPSPVMPPATGFTSISPSLQQESDESADVSSSPLPKSMREIYKISNENRRKKKKVKTVAGGPPSSMEEEEDSTPSSAADARKDSKKGNSTSNAGGVDRSSSQFMKTIGWGGASGTPPIHTSQPSNAAAQLLTNQNTTNTSDFKRKPNSAPPSGSASLSSSPPSNSPTFHSFDYSHATLPPSNPSAQPFFNPYQDIGRDKNELKAAAGTSGPATAANKIYKGHTQLKNQGKSVTVVHDNFQQRQRGASASSGIPIQRQQQQQRR